MSRPNFAIDTQGDFGDYLTDPDRLIPNAHLESVCKPNKGQASCRYLCLGPKGMICAKNTPMKQTLDKMVVEDSMIAKGDNCEGLGEDNNKEN